MVNKNAWYIIAIASPLKQKEVDGFDPSRREKKSFFKQYPEYSKEQTG